MEFWRWMKCQCDRVAAFVAFVAGLIALFLGWRGISDATLPSQQIPYLASATVLGLFGLGTAATLWLSADLRDEWRVLDDIRERLGEGGTTSLDSTAEASPSPSPEAGSNNHHDHRQAIAADGRAGR
jgi:hypothetical protein